MRQWWMTLRALATRSRAERELAEELDFHQAMQTARYRAAGLPQKDAVRRARADFGSLAWVADACRDIRGIAFFENVWWDVGRGLRSFCRTPTFALTVIATIGLGLGLNTAGFSIFNAYVLRPLPIQDPFSVYTFTWMNKAGNGHQFTWPEYQAFKASNHVFTNIFASRRQFVSRIDGLPAIGELVTGEYFQMLGVSVMMGRPLIPDDSSAPGRNAVAVLSDVGWKRLFGADPGIVGRTIRLQGRPLEVVGVAMKGFSGLGEIPYDFWVPLTLDAELEDGPSLFDPESPKRIEIVGRLNAGLTARSATAALSLWAQHATADRPEAERATTAVLESRATPTTLPPMLMLKIAPIVVAFALVLVIACSNVTNMMLARAMSRQREMGIRLSLGAGRPRLIRQLLTESLVLAVPAGVLAFAVASATIDVTVRVLFATLPPAAAGYIHLMPLTPDRRVLGFALSAAAGAAVLFGLAPALQATRASVVRATRGELLNDPRPQRLRSLLVAVQIAGATLLLITAAVLLNGTYRYGRTDPGLRTHDVLDLEIQDGSRERVLVILKTEPHVQRVVATSLPTPLAELRSPTLIATLDGSRTSRASYRFCSPEYFDALDIPLLSGRAFTEDEGRTGAPVAIVSESLAAELWSGTGATGRTIRITPVDTTIPVDVTTPGSAVFRFPVVEVVGVARNVTNGIESGGVAPPAVYLPASVHSPGLALLVRVVGEPESARRAIDRAIADQEPRAVEAFYLMRELLALRSYPFKVFSLVSVSVGLLALLLAMSGIYGVLSYIVTQRTKEIGLRMALGATARSVHRLVVGQLARLAVWGLLVGSVFALALSRVLASVLALVEPFDAVAYGVSLAVLFATCLAAAYLPAARAAGIDPANTLRHD